MLSNWDIPFPFYEDFFFSKLLKWPNMKGQNI